MKSVRELLSLLRTEYVSTGIDLKSISENPIEQFSKWFDEAIEGKVNLPDAMHLSTVGKEGRPSGRIVLLKGFNERGFIFFTNYNSRKGEELENNKYASLTFFWGDLYRQVRIEGKVQRTSEDESDEYFKSRPRESQIGTLASDQSRLLVSRDYLENKILELNQKYNDMIIPRPDNWGGFILLPESNRVLARQKTPAARPYHIPA